MSGPAMSPNTPPDLTRGPPHGRIPTLKRRSEFLRIRGGGRWSSPAFVLEGKPRDPSTGGKSAPTGPRFGFTITKQTGNAVERNRMRRRLKAAISALKAEHARPDYDYVVVARRPVLDNAFPSLVADLTKAFARVHTAPKGSPPKPRR
jgi:ribonuclease P protein component